MTTKSTEPPSDNQTDELTAYLDGELTPAETQSLESRLAADPNLRRELGQLQKAWDLLDAIPRIKADETFSTTTMSLAADLLKKETAVKRSKVNYGRWAAILFGGLLALVGLGAGYYVVDSVLQRPKREMERELHLLSNFATYNHLSENYLGDKNPEFLKLLQSSGLFVVADGGDTGVQFDPKTLDELSVEQKGEVIRHYQTLTSQSQGPGAAKYELMKTLAHQMDAEATKASLLRVHERYYAWLQSLSKSEIREIEEEKDPAARIEIIRTTWRRQSEQKLMTTLKDLRVILTREDYDIFRKWFCEFVQTHEQEIKESLKDRDSNAIRDMERITDPDRKRMSLYRIYSWRVGEGKAMVPSQEDFNRLASLLSDEAKKQFSSIEADEDQRRLVTKSLIEAAFRAHFLPPPTEEDLDKILKELTPAEREKLEHMRAIEQRRELTKRFEEKRMKTPKRSSPPEKSESKKNGPNSSSEFKPREEETQKAE